MLWAVWKVGSPTAPFKLSIIQGTKVTRDFVGKAFKRLRKFEHAAKGKPFSDERDGKTFCCSSLSWLLGFIIFLGSKKLLKLSGFSTEDIWVLAKPVPGDEKAGKVVATIALALLPPCSVLWHVAVPRAPWGSLGPGVTLGWNSGRFCPQFDGEEIGS